MNESNMAMNEIKNPVVDDVQNIRNILAGVNDPEVPVLSVLDLGIVREIIIDPEMRIVITPTYSGCPAMDMIKMNIRLALLEKY